MTSHIESTSEVRDNYTWGASACGCCAEYRDEDYEKFDRWLAAHDAEVAAKAWHEGHEVSCEDVDYICERFHPNPYRKAVQTK